MTTKKLRSLLVLTKLGTKLDLEIENQLRDYAIEVLEEAKSPMLKKIIDWFMDESTVVDEMRDCISEVWNVSDVVSFIRKWDPKLKKHDSRRQNHKGKN